MKNNKRSKPPRQLDLIKKPKNYCGGNLSSASKRELRVLSSKMPIHLVLKAHKKFNLFKHKAWIEKTLRKQAKNTHTTIYGLSVQKDHIHLNIKITSREFYRSFIRALSGLIARKLGKGIWKFRPFTRVVEWGRSFKTLLKYIEQNELEALGLIPYSPRNHHYKIVPPSTVSK